MAARSATINVMTKACYKAARGLIRDFGEVEQLQVSRKGPADFVSTADTKAETVLVGELKKARPGYGFLLEEGDEVKSEDPEGRRWIIDPLDGTTNFLHGIPHFCISVALEEAGEIIAGVVYEPLRDELFWAERGKGAYLNERRLRVSARQRMADALFATGIPFLGQDGHEAMLKQLAAVMAVSSGVRRQGAAALDLAYVAAGRYDGYWESGLHAWDIAAGLLLVQESGGLITDMSGRAKMLETGAVVAGNGHLQQLLLRAVRNATK